jgi:hypothetical protein
MACRSRRGQRRPNRLDAIGTVYGRASFRRGRARCRFCRGRRTPRLSCHRFLRLTGVKSGKVRGTIRRKFRRNCFEVTAEDGKTCSPSSLVNHLFLTITMCRRVCVQARFRESLGTWPEEPCVASSILALGTDEKAPELLKTGPALDTVAGRRTIGRVAVLAGVGGRDEANPRTTPRALSTTVRRWTTPWRRSSERRHNSEGRCPTSGESRSPFALIVPKGRSRSKGGTLPGMGAVSMRFDCAWGLTDGVLVRRDAAILARSSDRTLAKRIVIGGHRRTQ